MADCPNCGTETSGRYCCECGQDNLRERLESRLVLADVVHNLIGWDGALGRTLRGLLSDPGGMAADYVAGRRRHYVNPARFCLLALALWFFLTHLLGIDPMLSTGIQVRITGEAGRAAEISRHVREFLGDNLNVLLYLALPLLALLLRLAFRSSGRNLAECLALVLFLGGFRFLLLSLFLPLSQRRPELSLQLRMAVDAVWTVWAARGFFGVGLWGALWRVVLCKAGHLVGTLVFFSLVSIPWVFWTLDRG